jgi:hypothetical protein
MICDDVLSDVIQFFFIIVRLISISVGNFTERKVKILIDELRKYAEVG